MRLEKDPRLPHSRHSWHVCATESVESGSCARSSLRDRTPNGLLSCEGLCVKRGGQGLRWPLIIAAASNGQFELFLVGVHEGGEADADEAEGGGDEAVAGEEKAGEAVDVSV